MIDWKSAKRMCSVLHQQRTTSHLFVGFSFILPPSPSRAASAKPCLILLHILPLPVDMVSKRLIIINIMTFTITREPAAIFVDRTPPRTPRTPRTTAVVNDNPTRRSPLVMLLLLVVVLFLSRSQLAIAVAAVVQMTAPRIQMPPVPERTQPPAQSPVSVPVSAPARTTPTTTMLPRISTAVFSTTCCTPTSV